VEFEKVTKVNRHFKDIFQKYAPVMQKFNDLILSDVYQQEVESLGERYPEKNAEYIQELLKIKYKYIPEAEEMDREMGAFK
jgi:hypothetical protein